MSWKAHEIVFRLQSPLHSGWRKVGNLQQTRPYVPARTFRGALASRLTRLEAGKHPADDSVPYQKMVERIDQAIALTYFFPATKKGSGYQVAWPWDDPAAFRRRFLRSYASTALDYPNQAATEGSLHEVEFLSPRTIEDGRQVYLLGYVLEKTPAALDWRRALHALQLGGERGYGWGRVGLETVTPMAGDPLFSGLVGLHEKDGYPVLTLEKTDRLLAHTKADERLQVKGEIEPLVGREWRSDVSASRFAGQFVDFADLCFVPGSKVGNHQEFVVGPQGIWDIWFSTSET